MGHWWRHKKSEEQRGLETRSKSEWASSLVFPRWFLILGLATTSASAGCATKNTRAVQPTVKQAQKADVKAPNEEPYHVAPPPAYGNKIVRAELAGETPASSTASAYVQGTGAAL